MDAKILVPTPRVGTIVKTPHGDAHSKKKALSASADSAFLTSACQALGNPYSARLLLTTSYTSADSLPEARIRSSSAFISA